MPALLDAPTANAPISRAASAKRVAAREITWPGVAALAIILLFVGFVLWWTSSNFDKTEIKSWIAIGGTFVAHRLWPVIQAYLQPVGEASQLANE